MTVTASPAARRRRRTRGATIVEYALILAFFAVGVGAALDALGNNTQSFYDRTSGNVGGPSATTVVGPSSSTTSSTTTLPPGSTTTTTTSTTTTTTSAPRSTIASLTNVSADRGNNEYYARALVQVVNSATGAPIVGKKVKFTLYDAVGGSRNTDCTTGADGRCTIEWQRKDSEGPVSAEAYLVENPVPIWDGVHKTVILPIPSARSTVASVSNVSVDSGTDYLARAQVRVVDSQSGAAIVGAKVNFVLNDSAGHNQNANCTTAADGRCTIEWKRKDIEGPVTGEVVLVENSLPSWDGVHKTFSLPHP